MIIKYNLQKFARWKMLRQGTVIHSYTGHYEGALLFAQGIQVAYLKSTGSDIFVDTRFAAEVDETITEGFNK